MPTDLLISPTPEGSARHCDAQMLPGRAAAASAASAMYNRGGPQTAYAWQGTNSAWGLGGGDVGTMVLYKGASMYQIRGGCQIHAFRFPVISERPVAAIPKWRDELFVFESVLAWPTNTTGVENGITMCYTENAVNQQVISSTNPGHVIYNDNGVLKYGMRKVQAGAIQTTTILPAITVTELTKIRVEWRSATFTSDASMLVYINDGGSPVISRTSADANWPPPQTTTNSVINFGWGIKSATEYLYVRDICAWKGPNTTIGM